MDERKNLGKQGPYLGGNNGGYAEKLKKLMDELENDSYEKINKDLGLNLEEYVLQEVKKEYWEVLKKLKNYYMKEMDKNLEKVSGLYKKRIDSDLEKGAKYE